MKIENNSKIEIWQNHMARAKAHPSGVIAYCHDEGLQVATYYYWHKKIKNESSTCKKGYRSPKLKKTHSPFLPITVTESAIKYTDYSVATKLPEARWVAEVMLHLVQGLL